MSWIAYYVEVSSRQQEEEYARRFARPRPQVPAGRRGPAVRWPRWHWTRRPGHDALGATRRPFGHRGWFRASH